MQRLHPLRRGGVTNTNTTNTTHQGQAPLPSQTSPPLHNGSHTSSFSFHPSTIMHTPLPNSDLDDFEPLPDVADLFDDLPEEIARQASKRERDNGKSGKTSAGSRSSMALAPTTATTTAKRARVSTRTEPTAVQTLQELHGKSCSGQTHYSFDDDDIDFELDILSHDDDHHTPVIATNKSPSAQTADRSYSTMLNEAVRQVDHILRGSGGDPFDLGLNTRASPALSQTPTGFHALPETRDEQQEHWNGSSNESLSDTLSGHCKEDEPARDQACDNAREIGTEHLDQGTEEQPPGNVTGETSSTDPPAPAYSFMTPTSVNELEERLHGELSHGPKLVAFVFFTKYPKKGFSGLTHLFRHPNRTQPAALLYL